MPNRFTGDFQAVLEVSQATFDRLLASMHQNDGTVPGLPKLPHVAFIQVGGPKPSDCVDGVRGTVRTQVSVPRLELIDEATDRTGLEVWIRARFRPDPGSASFPEFVWGVLRVQYVVNEIRQNSRYPTALQLVVDPDQVFFTSSGPDTSNDAAITRQIVALLQTQFKMTPHPLLKTFSQRKLKSLVKPAGQAIASGLSLSGSALSGNLGQLHEVFLAGKDFALAVSSDFILALLKPALDALRATQPSFTITIKAPSWLGGGTIASATYTVTITSATAQWSAGTMTVGGVTSPAGVITLKISGKATTPSSLFPNASFDLTHDLWIGFNASTESLFVMSSGAPSVSTNINGPFGGLVEGNANAAVASAYNAQLAPALAQAQLSLQSSFSQKQTMIGQLQLIDQQADAHFDAAEFLPEGIILRGTISVSPRSIMQISYGPQANLSGYIAFQSWIPGGRIDRFDWRWFWFNAASGPFGGTATPDQTQTEADRFVLETNVSLPGLPPVPDDPGPSWPKMAGAICLAIRGVTVDEHTGAFTAVDSSKLYARERICHYLYPDPPQPPDPGIRIPPRLWWKIWINSQALPNSSAARELALLEAGTGLSGSPTFNHLIHYIDDVGAVETLSPLVEGLKTTGRDDAGLLVTVVFREGLLERGGHKLGARLDALSRHLDTPLITTEDVEQGWSQTFEIPTGSGGSATRLLTADRRLAWRRDGRYDHNELASALREHLVASDPPESRPVEPLVKIGEPAPEFEIVTGDAPAMRLDRLRTNETILVFVLPWSTPCIAQLKALQKLTDRLAARGATVVALVTAEESDQVRKLAQEHGLTYSVALDPRGSIASRYGIRIWPTMMTLDAWGRIRDIQAGTDPSALHSLMRETEPAG